MSDFSCLILLSYLHFLLWKYFIYVNRRSYYDETEKKDSSGGRGEPEAPHNHHLLNAPQRNAGAKEEASTLWRKPVAQPKKESAVSREGRGPGIKKKGRE